MKKRLNPTEILLRELPPEGRVYEYTQDSEELTEALSDLIEKNPYFVRLCVKPIGNAFDVQGEIQTSLGLQCSLCALDFTFPVSQKFHEVLVIQKPLRQGDQNVKTNHSSEWNHDQPEGIYLETPTFDVCDFIHELVAVAEPIRPLGRPDCETACENRQVPVQRDWLSVDSNKSESVKNRPFGVLEKLKLKS
jgi:uncharacterized metal-binding protein YceD (DUF177 family)